MQDSSEGKSTRDVQLTIREALGSKKEASCKESEAGFQESLDNSDEDEADFDARMRQQILKRRKELGDPPPKQKLLSGKNIYLNSKTKTTIEAHCTMWSRLICFVRTCLTKHFLRLSCKF